MRRFRFEHVKLDLETAAQTARTLQSMPDCMLELATDGTVTSVYGDPAHASVLRELMSKNLFLDIFPVFNTDEVLTDFAEHALMGDSNLLLEYVGGPYEWFRVRLVRTPKTSQVRTGMMASITRRMHDSTELSVNTSGEITHSRLLQSLAQKIA